MYNLELTKEELDFVYERCSRKAARLEESHLEDVPCFRIAWQVMSKIFEARKPKNTLPDNTLEVSRLTYEELHASGNINPNIIYLIKEN